MSQPSRVFKVSREGLVERRSTGLVLGQVIRKDGAWVAVLHGPKAKTLPGPFTSRTAAITALTTEAAR